MRGIQPLCDQVAWGGPHTTPQAHLCSNYSRGLPVHASCLFNSLDCACMWVCVQVTCPSRCKAGSDCEVRLQAPTVQSSPYVRARARKPRNTAQAVWALARLFVRLFPCSSVAPHHVRAFFMCCQGSCCAGSPRRTRRPLPNSRGAD